MSFVSFALFATLREMCFRYGGLLLEEQPVAVAAGQ